MISMKTTGMEKIDVQNGINNQGNLRVNRYSLEHEFKHSGGHANLKKLKENGPLIVINNSVLNSQVILN
jgi:hypothetical protein